MIKLTSDQRAEILMYSCTSRNTEYMIEHTKILKAVEQIINEHYEIFHRAFQDILEDEKQTNPMNGDGSNYTLEKCKKKLERLVL